MGSIFCTNCPTKGPNGGVVSTSLPIKLLYLDSNVNRGSVCEERTLRRSQAKQAWLDLQSHWMQRHRGWGLSKKHYQWIMFTIESCYGVARKWRACSSRFSETIAKLARWTNSTQEGWSPCSILQRSNFPGCRFASTDNGGTLKLKCWHVSRIVRCLVRKLAIISTTAG